MMPLCNHSISEVFSIAIIIFFKKMEVGKKSLVSQGGLKRVNCHKLKIKDKLTSKLS